MDSYWRRKHKKKMEENERKQLFNRKFNQKSQQPHINKESIATTIEMDPSLQYNNQVQNSNRNLDELLFTGSTILESLRSQRGMLKNAHERMLNLANTLGMSNDTIRLIQRRIKTDKFVFYGGIIVTLLIIFFVMFYFK